MMRTHPSHSSSQPFGNPKLCLACGLDRRQEMLSNARPIPKLVAMIVLIQSLRTKLITDIGRRHTRRGRLPFPLCLSVDVRGHHNATASEGE